MAILCLLAGPGTALAQANSQAGKSKSGAKALFFDPNRQSSLSHGFDEDSTETDAAREEQPVNVGIRYWIELEGVGPVTANRVFRTNDRIRLHATSNVEGYLFLWSLDSAGRAHLIFPPSDAADGVNFMPAEREYVTPGWIRFSPPVEDERMLIFFSPRELEEDDPEKRLRAARERSDPRRGAKSLIFETDEEEAETIGTYVINQAGGAVASQITLSHRRASEGR